MKTLYAVLRVAGATLVALAMFLAIITSQKLAEFPSGIAAFYVSVGVVLLIAVLVSVGAFLILYDEENFSS